MVRVDADERAPDAQGNGVAGQQDGVPGLHRGLGHADATGQCEGHDGYDEAVEEDVGEDSDAYCG